jgi:hypothetical protein
VGQKQSGFNPTDGVLDQSCELLPLLVRDGGPEVLNFDLTLADENNLGDFVDARHPGIADELRIKCGNAGRLFRISCGCGLRVGFVHLELHSNRLKTLFFVISKARRIVCFLCAP